MFVSFIIPFDNVAQILDQGETFLQSIQTALELVANSCYKEEGEDGRIYIYTIYPQFMLYLHLSLSDEDCDESWNGLEEEDIMAIEDPQQIIATAVVLVITETQLHRKVC